MTWRFVAADFDQMHQNTNVGWIADHPDAELVAVCDSDPDTSTGSMQRAVEELGLDEDQAYDALDTCLEATEPDVVFGAPKNSEHADFVETVAPYDVHVIVEKPMAMSLADADRMVSAMAGTDNLLTINWPVMWDPGRHAVRRLVQDEGVVGDVIEIQYYGGNAGAPPDGSWFYDPDAGGGSLLDYLGYGATFATWFRDGELPSTVAADTYVPPDQEVDVQSVTTCEYDRGLSTYQTTWRMISNPWEVQPQPPKGYEVVGTRGSVSTRDRGAPVRVQTRDQPDGYTVDPAPLPDRFTNAVHYLIDCLETGRDPTGPPSASFCREAQRIIETAQRSAERGERLELVE